MASDIAPPTSPAASHKNQAWPMVTFLLTLIRTTTKLLHFNTNNTMTTPFPILALPIELRLMIYQHIILSQRRYRWVTSAHHQTRIICHPPLLLASRLLRAEALPVFARIASAETHIFVSGMRNLHDFVQRNTHLLPGLTRLTLMAWDELGNAGVPYQQRLELCEDAGRALREVRAGCGRLGFLRLQVEVLWRNMPEDMGVEMVRGLWGWKGVRIVGDRGTMRVLGH